MREKLCESKESHHCGESFNQIADDMLNRKTLPGITPCESSVCGEVGTGHSSLNRHIRADTGHKSSEYQEYGENPYRNKECKKAFSYLDSFQSHDKACTKEKPYDGKECAETFISHSCIQRHRVMHSGGRRYKCKLWGKPVYVLFMNKLPLERNHVNADNVVIPVPFECMTDLTLGRSPVNVRNVGKHSIVPVPLKHIKELTLGRGHMNVNNMVKPSPIPFPFKYTKELT